MSLAIANAHNAVRQEGHGYPTSKIATMVIDDSDNITGRMVNDSKSNLEQALKNFERAKLAILSVSDDLHKQMDAQSKRAKESVSRAKDSAAQMADAMNRITKVLGPDFEKRLAQLEQLTNCMERLAALDAAGKLAPVLGALR